MKLKVKFDRLTGRSTDHVPSAAVWVTHVGTVRLPIDTQTFASGAPPELMTRPVTCATGGGLTRTVGAGDGVGDGLAVGAGVPRPFPVPVPPPEPPPPLPPPAVPAPFPGGPGVAGGALASSGTGLRSTTGATGAATPGCVRPGSGGGGVATAACDAGSAPSGAPAGSWTRT